jgi:hypothetical protein
VTRKAIKAEMKQKNIGPRTEAETRRIDKIAAAQRTPEARAHMSVVQQEKFKDPVRGPLIRKHISDGTTAAYKRPEVKENLSNALVDIWKNAPPQRRERARELAKEILCNPEIVAQARVAHATPETSKAISEGNTQSWAKDPERRKRTSVQFKQLWVERRRKLALVEAAWRPADWWKMPVDWRIIGGELLSQPYMSNTDLGARLDGGRIIKCPYGPKDSLWEDALSSDKQKKVKAAIKLVTEIRKWVGRPGRNPAKISGQTTVASPPMRLF